MARVNKAVNFLHSSKGYMLATGIFLVVLGYILQYFVPTETVKIDKGWISGAFPNMSVMGFGIMIVPYLGIYIIQTIASKIGKNPPPAAP